MFVEPSVQAWALNKHWLMDVADWTYLNAPLLRHDRRAGVHLPAPQRLVLLRAQHVHDRDGDRADRLLAVPDGAAAADARVGLHRLDLAVPDGGTGSIDDGPTKALLNFYAAVPSMHVCFAVMIGGSMVRLVALAPAKIAWALYPL